MRVENHPLDAAFAALLEHGLDGAGEALRILVNEASKIERAHFLNAQSHERTPERTDYANGFKPKTVMTRVGQVTFDVPQVRGSGFYPSALEKGSRTEQALNIALAEIYVQGVSVALSEAEVHWRAFIDSLVRRGMKGVKLIISDDHAGLKAARRAALPSVPWQRRQFHLQLNAQAYITRIDQRKPVAQRIRAIFNAPDKAEAERMLKQSLEIWAKDAPKLAQWAQENLPMGFLVFDFPQEQRTRLRTTNGLERINRELKRRTRVASIFPNTASCLRLVSALLAECDEEWMSGQIYLNLRGEHTVGEESRLVKLYRKKVARPISQKPSRARAGFMHNPIPATA